MLKSKNTHKIQYRNLETSTTGFKDSKGARNGEGSSTNVYISDTIESGDIYSDGSQRTEAAVVAHEFFGHSYDADKGVISDEVNAETGVKFREERAVRTENIFRGNANLKERTEYGRKKVELEE